MPRKGAVAASDNVLQMSGIDSGNRPADAVAANTGQTGTRKTRVSQGDVPYYTLDEALRIPRAIADNYAYQPSRPLEVALALSIQPASSTFRMLAGSSIAYGLTSGGPNAPAIAVTPLARRILDSTDEGDQLLARREALFKPRVLREFLTKYDGNKLPRENIAMNVLSGLGVPHEAAQRTLKLIIDSARSVGVLQEIKGAMYVNLKSTALPPSFQGTPADEEAQDSDSYEVSAGQTELPDEQSLSKRRETTKTENRRVFITHGRNKSFIEPLKELLGFGELEPVVSVERQSVSQPVPDKVMNDMRTCSAAIIHVDAEEELLDKDANRQVVLNPNVLIEIGAALALYGRRFILLVKNGITLPSNLQGLYEVRYDDDKLDGDTTIRLLKAIRDIKNHPLPALPE